MPSLMHAGEASHNETGHGDRPWVYFMVDCFFLITEFFMLTFKFKQDEFVLPQKLPPGSTANQKQITTLQPKEQIKIAVSRQGDVAIYNIQNTRQVQLPELIDTLQHIQVAGKEYSVRVSYERLVPWKDVMAVFNACKKLDIKECGLIPLR